MHVPLINFRAVKTERELYSRSSEFGTEYPNSISYSEILEFYDSQESINLMVHVKHGRRDELTRDRFDNVRSFWVIRIL